MTVVNPKSISGINSITMASGSDNLLTIHTTNTTERVRINSSGDVIVGSGITLSQDGDIFTTGITTFTNDVQFVGNSGISSITYDKSANQLNFVDNTKARFGSGGDLEIYHNGSASYIDEGGTGALYIRGSDLYLTDEDGTNMLYAANNAGVSLHYGGGVKLATNSDGVDFGDNVKLRLGDAPDYKIYHNGSHTYHENYTGDLFIKSDQMYLMSWTSGEQYLHAVKDGRVALFYDNTMMIETISTGTNIPDGKFAKFGNSNDMSMGHNTYNYITYTGADFLLTGDATNQIKLMPKSDEAAIICKPNAEVELFHDGTLQCETSANGLAFPNGKGIDFSATGGGSNTSGESELFSDYEQGSCTILIHDAAGSNISVTGGNHKYTKIGNRVFVEGQFTFAESGSKNGGLMQLYQLPFTPAQVTPAGGNFWYDGPSDATDVTGLVYVHTNGTCYLKQSTTQGQNSNQKYLTFNEIAANSNRILFVSFTYIT